MTWATAEAKAKFSELLDRAETEGPQLVRRRKREFLVLTRETHEVGPANGKHAPAQNAWDALQPSFKARYDVTFPRLKNRMRKVDLG